MENECPSSVEAPVGIKAKKFRAAGVISLSCVCGWFVMELEILGVRMLTPPQAIAQARILQPKHRFSFNILTVAKKLKPNIRPPDSAIVLTDDRAPVNWLRSQPKK